MKITFDTETITTFAKKVMPDVAAATAGAVVLVAVCPPAGIAALGGAIAAGPVVAGVGAVTGFLGRRAWPSFKKPAPAPTTPENV